MKKILSLLFLLPLIALVSACHDDDGSSLPDVTFNLDVANPVATDGVIYVVQGNDFTVNSLSVTNQEQGKGAGITAASYYWDYDFLGTTTMPPFSMKINIGENVELGEHLFEVQCPVFALDKEPAQAYLQYTVMVVASEDEIPAETTNSLVKTAKTVQDN